MRSDARCTARVDDQPTKRSRECLPPRSWITGSPNGFVPAPGALGAVRKDIVCVCFAAILCGVSRSAAAAVDQYIGKPIASVDLTVEGRPTTDAAVLSVLETRVGQPLSVAAVRESIAHLYSLGRFDDVRVDASEVGGGRVALRYDLSPLHPTGPSSSLAGSMRLGLTQPRCVRQSSTDMERLPLSAEPWN